VSLKTRVKKLEKRLGGEDDLDGARDLVKFAVQFGIFPQTIDIEKAAQAFAEDGLTMEMIFSAVVDRNKGKLPSEAPEEIDKLSLFSQKP
jgi:hypothetical protein